MGRHTAVRVSHRRWAPACALALAATCAARAADVRFDPRLVFGGPAQARDITSFDHGSPVASGIYRSEIFLNGRYLLTRSVAVHAARGRAAAHVCLDRAVVRALELDRRRLSHQARRWLAGQGTERCLRPAAIAASLSARFDLSRLRVDIHAASILLQQHPRGWVSPRSWSNGIVAGRMNYEFDATRSSVGGQASQAFLGLAAGVNVGAWQLRHRGALHSGAAQGLQYTSTQTFVRHDIAALGGYVLLGQGQSDGELLDSFGFEGVLLASERRMLPASRQGYAPTIRGYADAAATVRVTQNGNLLTQRSVPAGPFAIDDLYPPASGSALQVTVTDASGHVTRFSVPVSSVPQLQRRGQARYQLLLGRTHVAASPARWPLLLGTLQYGVGNFITAEIGAMASRSYRSGVLGLAANTRAGALALDLSGSRVGLAQGTMLRGQRIRATWNGDLIALHCAATASQQSYGYENLQDAVTAASPGVGALDALAAAHLRDDVQLDLALDVGVDASLFLSTERARYWEAGAPQMTFQFGYTHGLGRAQFTISAGRQLGTSGAPAQNSITLSLSVPLGASSTAPTAVLGWHNAGGHSGGQWSLSGPLGESGQLSYGVQGVASSGARGLGASVSWRTQHGTVGAAASSSRGSVDANTLSVNANGGVVVFDGGAVFTPYLGDTIALIQATGATGAQISGAGGSTIDSAGYGVATYLTPYTADTVGIDPAAALAAHIRRSSALVVPRAGAIVGVRLRAHAGNWVLLSSELADGSPLPFAAQAFDSKGRFVGYVGQDSLVDAYLRRDTDAVWVRWGPNDARTCRIDFRLPPPRAPDVPLAVHGTRCATVARAATRSAR